MQAAVRRAHPASERWRLQLADELRSFRRMSEDNTQPTCPAQRHIEHAALFRVRILIWDGKHKREKRVLGALGRKSILSPSRAHDDDVVSLGAFCRVNRHPSDAQRSVGLLYLVLVRRK